MSCSLFSGSDNECDMGRRQYYPTRKKVSDSEQRLSSNTEEGVSLLSEMFFSKFGTPGGKPLVQYIEILAQGKICIGIHC
jgi:hypothetical protein